MPEARRPKRSSAAIVEQALEILGGASIVLDGSLATVYASPSARALTADALAPGTRLAKLLCGESPERPVAEALSSGQAVTADVVRPGRGGRDQSLRVQALPLRSNGRLEGYLVRLSVVAAADSRDTEEMHGILTRDATMKRVLSEVRRVARSDVSVLVRGETGSGKELVARAIHLESRRAKGPFRAINCAALPAQLLESELFGHVRGAFTGAVRDAEGHMRLASGGTLFLDEVAEIPLELQAKLLRVLQDRVVLPIGGREPIPVDVRFVAATHRGLRQEVAEGRFRADLMYRLRVVPIFLPPLRERPEDVGLLADHFVRKRNQEHAPRIIERIDAAALSAMLAYDFPGNVRELQNAIEYAFVMGEGSVLSETDLPPEFRGEYGHGRVTNAPPPVRPSAQGAEARRILRALERASGNRARAAKSLGMSRVTLWRKLKALGIETESD
ncbi:MAG: sigma 54-interacting transcriptional regulator [Polyangiaceae bacterium]